MDINQVVEFLRKHLDDSDLKVDIDGLVRVELDNSLKVELFYDDNNDLVMLGVVKEGIKDTPAIAEDLKKYLKMNFSRFHVQEDILTLDPTRERLVLFRKIAQNDIKEDIIVERLEKLLNNLDIWYGSLNNDKGSSEASASQPFFITP